MEWPTYMTHSPGLPLTRAMPVTICRRRMLFSLLTLCFSAGSAAVVDEGVLMASFTFWTWRSVYKAAMVCLMKLDDATYSCSPMKRRPFISTVRHRN